MIDYTALLFEINKIKTFKNYSLEIVNETKSTNDDLKKDWPNYKPRILIAKEQTQGRGQFNREWSSPKDKGIYFSFTHRNTHSNDIEFPLSIIAGLSLYSAILEFSNINTEKLWLKWPNDIFLSNKKLAGILSECTPQSKQKNYIVGIGINIYPPKVQGRATAGLVELSLKPDIFNILLRFFQNWQTNILLSNSNKIRLWKALSKKFLDSEFILSTPDKIKHIVKANTINPDGSLNISSPNNQHLTIYSSKNLQIKLDKAK